MSITRCTLARHAQLPCLMSGLTFPAPCQTHRATAGRMLSDEAHGRYDHRGTPQTLSRVDRPGLLRCGGSTSPVKCVLQRARSVLRPASARRCPACSCFRTTLFPHGGGVRRQHFCAVLVFVGRLQCVLLHLSHLPLPGLPCSHRCFSQFVRKNVRVPAVRC